MQQYFAVKKENNNVYLNTSDLNHIKNVMRMHENDKIIAVYDNVSYICTLNSDLLSAKIENIFKTSEENIDLTIYVPLVKEDKMSLILQKGTEMGATKFIVVIYEHSKYKLEKKDYEKKLIRWNKIIKEASEQCYRIKKPILDTIVNVNDINVNTNVNVLCSLVKTDVKYISNVLNADTCGDTISVAFGPEGGFTNKEEEILVSKGFTRVSLGTNVLRVETAFMYVISIIMYLRGSVKWKN